MKTILQIFASSTVQEQNQLSGEYGKYYVDQESSAESGGETPNQGI